MRSGGSIERRSAEGGPEGLLGGVHPGPRGHSRPGEPGSRLRRCRGGAAPRRQLPAGAARQEGRASAAPEPRGDPPRDRSGARQRHGAHHLHLGDRHLGDDAGKGVHRGRPARTPRLPGPALLRLRALQGPRALRGGRADDAGRGADHRRGARRHAGAGRPQHLRRPLPGTGARPPRPARPSSVLPGGHRRRRAGPRAGARARRAGQNLRAGQRGHDLAGAVRPRRPCDVRQEQATCDAGLADLGQQWRKAPLEAIAGNRGFSIALGAIVLADMSSETAPRSVGSLASITVATAHSAATHGDSCRKPPRHFQCEAPARVETGRPLPLPEPSDP